MVLKLHIAVSLFMAFFYKWQEFATQYLLYCSVLLGIVFDAVPVILLSLLLCICIMQ